MSKDILTLSFPIVFNDIRSELEKNRQISQNAIQPHQKVALPTQQQDPVQAQNPQSNKTNFSEDQGFKKFTGVAYSGKVIPRHGDKKNIYMDIDSMSFQDQVPILSQHIRGNEVGFGHLKVENNQLMIDGIVSTKLEEGRRIIELQNIGFEWKLSVGIDPRNERIYGEGMTFMVNGTQAQGFATVIHDAVVLETSILSIPADRSSETKFN